MTAPTNQEYIGDGVYATFCGYSIKLTTDRGRGHETIYIEPEVMHRLIEYAIKVGMLSKG